MDLNYFFRKDQVFTKEVRKVEKYPDLHTENVNPIRFSG